MNFRIADTFTDSLARLTGEEQKLVKTTAFDLQVNPANPGMSFHKLDRAKDKNFWSVRAGRDIRIIVHKTQADLLLCHVDHHDKAYAWAERRKLETHPKTGAAQLVEIRERVVEIETPRHLEVPAAGPAKIALFTNRSDEELLGYGVPPEWLDDVRRADEDRLLELADHLPAEAAEALLELATGGEPQVVRSKPATADPFAHPDAQRRFRIMTDVEELARALDAPWDKWTVFLHPAQRQWVERDFNGPARVSGSAGTGKTIVALHRAVHLARRHPESRVLLTTFSDALANALASRLRRLVGNEPRVAERIEVGSLDAVGARLYERRFGRFVRATPQAVCSAIAKAAKAHPEAKSSAAFLLSEWNDLVDAWQLDSWEAYRDVKRLGRKTRLPEARRAALWSVFDAVRRELAQQKLVTVAAMFGRLAADVAAHGNAPFDFVVVDESQDLTPAQLRFLGAVAARQPNGLFFAGDLGQRIFQQPFSWRALGVDVRGRSRTLHVNYRTSHQIRSQADRLLGVEVSDVDGNIESRKGTVSVFNGPQPSVERHETEAKEIAAVAAWIAARRSEGVAAEEIGIFVRSDAELPRAQAAVSAAGAKFTVLDERAEAERESIAISSMHLAKGLEFRAVVVMACDDEICPLQSRIEAVSDEADLEEVYATERHLLYVACTRAREHLLVTGVAPGSEFLADLGTVAVPA